MFQKGEASLITAPIKPRAITDAGNVVGELKGLLLVVLGVLLLVGVFLVWPSLCVLVFTEYF